MVAMRSIIEESYGSLAIHALREREKGGVRMVGKYPTVCHISSLLKLTLHSQQFTQEQWNNAGKTNNKKSNGDQLKRAKKL